MGKIGRAGIWAGLVVAGVLVLGLVASEHGVAQQQDTDAIAPNGLQLQSRDHVAICVEVASEATTPHDQAVVEVRSVLPNLRASTRWEEIGLGSKPAEVDAGCPSEPYLLRPGVDGTQMFREIDAPRARERPSKYLVHLMVLSDAQVERLFGAVRYPAMRLETHEYFCPDRGHTCVGVSSGMYLSDSELTDDRYLPIILTAGLGLGDEMPMPAPEGESRDRNGRPIRKARPDPTSSVPADPSAPIR